MKNLKQFKSWLKKRPRKIRELAAKFPPGRYRVVEGAPYSISCSGTEVTLVSYKDDMTLGCIIEPKNLLPEAKEHIKRLNFNYKHPPEHGLDSPQLVSIEQQYLEPIEHYVR